MNTQAKKTHHKNNHRVFITGGTGLIGTHLQKKFHSIDINGTILTRSKHNKDCDNIYGFNYTLGDIITHPWQESIQGYDSIIHLAGFPLFEKKWSTATKKLIRDSRVIGTKNLVKAVSDLNVEHRPKNVICASAVGYYGTSFDQTFDESSPPGDDFLADIAKDWEKVASELQDKIDNLTIIRIGIVLSCKGGMLYRVLPIFKSGLGGRLSSGKQWISWVHIDDVVEVIVKSITDSSWQPGIYNLSSPNPVTNLYFTKKLGSLLKRPSFIPVPQRILTSILGEGSYYVVTGQKVIPKKLLDIGFKFSFEDLDSALNNLLKKS